MGTAIRRKRSAGRLLVAVSFLFVVLLSGCASVQEPSFDRQRSNYQARAQNKINPDKPRTRMASPSERQRQSDNPIDNTADRRQRKERVQEAIESFKKQLTRVHSATKSGSVSVSHTESESGRPDQLSPVSHRSGRGEPQVSGNADSGESPPVESTRPASGGGGSINTKNPRTNGDPPGRMASAVNPTSAGEPRQNNEELNDKAGQSRTERSEKFTTGGNKPRNQGNPASRRIRLDAVVVGWERSDPGQGAPEQPPGILSRANTSQPVARPGESGAGESDRGRSTRPGGMESSNSPPGYSRSVLIGLLGLILGGILGGFLVLIVRQRIFEQPSDSATRTVPEPGDSVREIPLDKVVANPYQPRSHIDEDKLDELAVSIKEHGVITPIQVQPGSDGTYQLIAGERRVRACRKLGRESIPALLRNMSPEQLREVSFLENLQRESMNPVDRARAYRRLRREFRHLDYEELGNRVGKSPEEIKRYEWILDLSTVAQEALAREIITLDTARELLHLAPTDQKRLIQFVAEQDPDRDEVRTRIRELRDNDSDRPDDPLIEFSEPGTMEIQPGDAGSLRGNGQDSGTGRDSDVRLPTPPRNHN